MQNELVTIFITPIDVEKFKLFQKHYVAFMLMDSLGAFNLKNGSITLNFDNQGQIKAVKKEELFRPDIISM